MRWSNCQTNFVTSCSWRFGLSTILSMLIDDDTFELVSFMHKYNHTDWDYLLWWGYLSEHWLQFLWRSIQRMPRYGEVDALYAAELLDLLCIPSPRMEYEAIWKGAILLQNLLQLAEGLHTMHLQTCQPYKSWISLYMGKHRMSLMWSSKHIEIFKFEYLVFFWHSHACQNLSCDDW